MSSDIININVGGIKYCTSRGTLCKYPESLLYSMFADTLPSQVDQNGYYFIDRDGEIFRYILQYLRTDKLSLPKDFKDFDLLKHEIDFYQIRPLIQTFLKENTYKPIQMEAMNMIIFSYISGNYNKKYYCRKLNSNPFEIINSMTETVLACLNKIELIDNRWKLIEETIISTKEQMLSFIMLLDFSETSFDDFLQDVQKLGSLFAGKISYYARK